MVNGSTTPRDALKPPASRKLHGCRASVAAGYAGGRNRSGPHSRRNQKAACASRATQRGHRPHGVTPFRNASEICANVKAQPRIRRTRRWNTRRSDRLFLPMSVRRNLGHDMETCSLGTRVSGHACEHARICAVPWTQPLPIRPLPLLPRWAALLFQSVRAGRRHAQPLGSMEPLI
jgi:hypothetical protein